MDDKRNLDRRAIGYRIGQVRRWADLSPTAFAQSLQVPTMILEIAEHGIREADGTAAAGIELSVKELRPLLETISDVYKIPIDWLMYGEGSVAKFNRNLTPTREELLLYLPVTISEQSLVDELNKALLFIDTDRFLNGKHLALHREFFENIVQKYRLYVQYAVRIGNRSYARRARRRMLDAIENIL